VIDADPYGNGGNNWYTNQNNFYRSVRNFVIDLRQGPSAGATAFHWQVSQGEIFSVVDETASLTACANSDLAHEHSRRDGYWIRSPGHVHGERIWRVHG
jgi:hypothetical protein